MNNQLIDSLMQVIRALPSEERAALTEKLFLSRLTLQLENLPLWL